MDQDQIAIQKLLFLPDEFGGSGKSIMQLVEQHGILEQYKLGTITTRSLVYHLSFNKSIVDLWLNWSLDKRSNGAYFREIDKDTAYEVGGYPQKHFETKFYDDPLQACAEFIIKELDRWAEIK